MIRPEDRLLEAQVRQKLIEFNDIIPMPGIADPATMSCFVEQLIDSIKRIKYVTVIKNKIHTVHVADATCSAFDPIKAASYHAANGNLDEAFWLIFLSTHFGRNLRTKWKLVANVYGAMVNPAHWTWQRVSGDVQSFRDWLSQNEDNVKRDGKFGNHRKYQSINALQNNGTGNSIATYVDWILSDGNHAEKFGNVILANAGNAKNSFAQLYREMDAVANFGRMAKFDYLTMVGKMGLASIEPNSTYMVGATGPVEGSKLLFGVDQTAGVLGSWVDALEDHLGLYFGMQVLEDAICNWQKSPENYIHFRG